MIVKKTSRSIEAARSLEHKGDRRAVKLERMERPEVLETSSEPLERFPAGLLGGMVSSELVNL
jgi:hypothetical protein